MRIIYERCCGVDVLTTGQVRRHRYAIFVGGHAADKRPISVIDIKLNAGNRFTRVIVCFGQPNATLHGDVLNADSVGPTMFSYIELALNPLLI